MSSTKMISALKREWVGKGAARAIRREGRVPAVIYGGKEAATSISLDRKEITMTIYAGHFLSTVFEIDVEGKKTQVIPRDYQLDPVRDSVEHVDFLRLAKGQDIKVTIPFHIIDQDKCPGAKRGGTIQVVEHSIELLVPSNAIPEQIVISVAELDIGDTIHLDEVKLPKGAKAVSADNITIVTVVGIREEDADEAEVDEEVAQ